MTSSKIRKHFHSNLLNEVPPIWIGWWSIRHFLLRNPSCVWAPQQQCDTQACWHLFASNSSQVFFLSLFTCIHPLRSCWVGVLPFSIILQCSHSVTHIHTQYCSVYQQLCGWSLCGSTGAAGGEYALLVGILIVGHYSLTFPTSTRIVWVWICVRVTLSHLSRSHWEMPLCHFYPLPHILLLSPSLWPRCEVPPLSNSLVTAYLRRSQAQASGTAPRSGLGDRGVSQETKHKYRDPNNLITSGAIRRGILGACHREGVCVCSKAVEG